MAKGQMKSNKEAKKPKKETAAPKPAAGIEPIRSAVVNTVYTKLKAKDR
jgi:hypothetical protein